MINKGQDYLPWDVISIMSMLLYACMTKTNLNVALYGVSCICIKYTHIFHSLLKQLRQWSM